MFKNQETQNPKDIDPIREWCMKRVKSSDVFIDCGAHIGRASLPVIVEKKPKFSILIEATPASAKILRDNSRDIKESYVIINKVAYSEKRNIIFTVPVDSHIQASLYDRFSPNKEAVEKIEMETITIDDILDEYEIKGDIVMKLDVELSEWFVWKGMKRHLRQFRDICMEFMPTIMQADAGVNPYEFIDDIRISGYDVLNLDGSIPNGRDIFNPKGSKIDLYLKRQI